MGLWVYGFIWVSMSDLEVCSKEEDITICMAYLHFLLSIVFKCSSAECILTRRGSLSCNHAYQCLVTKINMTMN